MAGEGDIRQERRTFQTVMDEEGFRAFVDEVKELLEQHGAELPPTDTGEPWGT